MRPQSYLICDDESHADFIDHLIMARLRDVDGAQGSSWSGIYTDGTRYGVLWGSPASSLFGTPYDPANPDSDPLVVVVEEVVTQTPDGQTSDWRKYEPPAPPPDSIL